MGKNQGAHHEIPGSEIFGGRGGLAHGNDMGQGQKHREYRREQPPVATASVGGGGGGLDLPTRTPPLW